jgi:hypothetical protein
MSETATATKPSTASGEKPATPGSADNGASLIEKQAIIFTKEMEVMN